MRTTIRISISVIAAIGLLGCDKSPTKPASLVDAPVVLSSFSITSMPTGTAIGQTFQLVATAVFSDRATKIVTSEAVWTSLDPAIATVSASGVVTVMGFGVCNITAKYQTVSTTRQFSAILQTSGLTPFHLSGVVTGDDGRSLVGAKVITEYRDGQWQETSTDAGGRYELDFEARVGAYMRGSTANVIVIGDGYERLYRWFRPTSTELYQTLDLHPRAIRWINAGESVSVTVADDGEPCVNNVRDMPNYSVHYVCRTVRILVPADGVLTATAAGADPGVQVLVEMEDISPGILDCCYLGNPLSMTVTAGMVVSISVEILEGVPSQTFKLTATIR